MTEQELVQLEALAKAATPGPWGESPCSNGGALLKRGEAHGQNRHDQSSVQILPASDAAYIAAMHPQTTLELVAEVRRLRELVESAYLEGLGHLSHPDVKRIAREYWENSDARKALGEP